MIRVVIDTNVLTSAMLSPGGENQRLQPLVGQALLSEYEDVLGRESLFNYCVLNAQERTDLLGALLSVSEWVKIYFSWRPNLPDEGDNHLVELAVAGGALRVVTCNHRDLAGAELLFSQLRAVSPARLLEELR